MDSLRENRRDLLNGIYRSDISLLLLVRHHFKILVVRTSPILPIVQFVTITIYCMVINLSKFFIVEHDGDIHLPPRNPIIEVFKKCKKAGIIYKRLF